MPTMQKTKRSIKRIPLLFASVSAILGSGWLFSAYYASVLAGPSALLSWLFAGAAVIIVAFVFAELSAMLPVTGSSVRVPHCTHGTLVSFVFSWLIWLSYVAFTPTEVQAVVQYLSYYFPGLLYPDAGLTHRGYLTATGLMLLVSMINVFSLRWLMRCNTLLTLLKVLIPAFIALVLIGAFFSPHQLVHPGHSTFMPFGLHGVFAAMASGGIVFAFNGFKQACEMAGEAENPSRSLPFAIVGSVLLCLLLYLLLQIAFLVALTPADLAQGWEHMALAHGSSPLAAISTEHHLSWMLPLLYTGAIIGPLAAGLMYAGSAARSLSATSHNGYLPEFLQRVTTHGSPIIAIVINFAFGMLLFAPLPGWDKMVTFLTSLIAVTYAIGPISLVTLRRQLPHQRRPFKLPFPLVWGTLAFYVCTLLIYWSGWQIVSKLGLALVAGLVILAAYHLGSKRGRQVVFDWKASTWMWLYFIGISVISWLGNFGGGLGVIPFGWDFLVIFVFSVGIIELARRVHLPIKKTEQHLATLLEHSQEV